MRPRRPVSRDVRTAATSPCSRRRLALSVVVALCATFPPASASGQRRILTRTLPGAWKDATSAGRVRVVDPKAAATVVNDADEIRLDPGQVAVAKVEKGVRTEIRRRPGTANAVDTVRVLP